MPKVPVMPDNRARLVSRVDCAPSLARLSRMFGSLMTSVLALSLCAHAAYVIMIAGANEIAASAVGLVYFCAIGPTILVKLTAPYWSVDTPCTPDTHVAAAPCVLCQTCLAARRHTSFICINTESGFKGFNALKQLALTACTQHHLSGEPYSYADRQDCIWHAAHYSSVDASTMWTCVHGVAVQVSSGVLHHQVLGGGSPYDSVLLCGRTLTQYAGTGVQ
jgi:hypothetical protein